MIAVRPAVTIREVTCDFCGSEFDPIATRWLCPRCHMKTNCCDGAPLPLAAAVPSSATWSGIPMRPSTGCVVDSEI